MNKYVVEGKYWIKIVFCKKLFYFIFSLMTELILSQVVFIYNTMYSMIYLE